MTPEHLVDPALRIGWKPFSYERSVPSVRLRALMPCEALSEAGYRTSIIPRDGTNDDYDVVVFQKAYRDDDIALARRFKARGVAVVLDLCDNHFYNPEGDPTLAARADRLWRMVDLADVVTVSTPELADVLPGRLTVVVDDALETWPAMSAWGRLRRVRRAHERVRRVRLVWFGNGGSDAPEFGIVHLGRLVPVLEELRRELPIELTVISNSRSLFERHVAAADFPTHYVEWSQRSFARVFTRHDICLLPVELNPFTVCKTNNRIRSSLLLGVPVVSSPLPRYKEFERWVLFDDWARHVRLYAEQRELAGRHVRDGRAYVLSTYTSQRLVAQWAAALAESTRGAAA